MDLQRRHFGSIDSTNSWARNHLGDLDASVIHMLSADQQTAGRGRHGRNWLSPLGVNLYVTFVLQSLGDPAELTQLLALAIVKELEKVDVRAQIKWPNDVLLGGQKLAGILCEAVLQPRPATVIGYGLNVNMEAVDLIEVDQAATSLLQETNRRWDRESLQESILQGFLDLLKSYHAAGFTSIEAEIMQRLYLK